MDIFENIVNNSEINELFNINGFYSKLKIYYNNNNLKNKYFVNDNKLLLPICR